MEALFYAVRESEGGKKMVKNSSVSTVADSRSLFHLPLRVALSLEFRVRARQDVPQLVRLE